MDTLLFNPSNDNANVFDYGYFEDPLNEFFNSFDTNPNLISLDEVTYQERAKKAILNVEVLDVERYIKVNELKEITNPTFFGTAGLPTSDGLLSNEIFGITQKDRAGTFAYIDLHEYFIDPSCYKTLERLDSKFKFIINGLKFYKIDPEGNLVEDPSGSTGIKWLKDNFSKIKFKSSGSRARDMRIKYIQHNFSTKRMFISKYIVIPAYYRDVNTSGKHTGVGQINTLYVNLITASRALQENNDYGLSMADTTCARIQETLKTIYDWFCGNSNDSIKDKGTGLGGKTGIIRYGNMNYTSDYSSRLVLSAPELKVDSVDDLMVSLDKSAIPLAAVAADFYPFMLFHIRKFFENEFLNLTTYECIDPNTNAIINVELENPMLYFNDDELKDQIKKFVYSHDNRFIPIKVPSKDNRTWYMSFKGQKYDPKTGNVSPEPAYHRPLTWVDIIYIAAMKSTDGKQMSFTRYPYDSYFNTIYTGIEVSSTKETEPLIVMGEYYRFYPKIRKEDINQSSAQRFIDTMQISNLYLNGLGGDYDGDMGQVKGSFFKETNDELIKYRNSKSNYINLGCKNIRVSEKEAIQASYNLTLILNSDKDKITNPEF